MDFPAPSMPSMTISSAFFRHGPDISPSGAGMQLFGRGRGLNLVEKYAIFYLQLETADSATLRTKNGGHYDEKGCLDIAGQLLAWDPAGRICFCLSAREESSSAELFG